MMRKQLWCSAAVGFLAAALLAGCGQKTDAEVPSENKTEKTNPVSVTQVKEPEAVSAEDFERRSQVRENNPVSGEFVSAAQAFSYDSAARLLAEGTENRNYSPLSLYYALALAAQGAEGKTEEEMLAVLGMMDKDELAAQCGNLYRLLYTDHEYSRLKLANSLWTQQGVAFKDGFLKNCPGRFLRLGVPGGFCRSGGGNCHGTVDFPEHRRHPVASDGDVAQRCAGDHQYRLL